MSFSSDDEDPFEDQREGTDNAMRRLFAEYGRKNAFSFLVGTLTSVVARMLDLLPPLLLGIAIDAVLNQNQPFGLGPVPQAWLPTTRTQQFWLIAGIIAFAFFGGAIFHYGRNWGWNSFSQNIQHQIRTDTYDKMQRLNMDFFADKQTGEMMSVLSNDVNRLEQFLNGGMNSVFRLAAMVLGIATVMFLTNWQLALIALSPIPLIAAFTYYFVKKIQPKYAAVRSSVGEMNSRLENNLGGIQVIKSTNTEGYESDRVDDVRSRTTMPSGAQSRCASSSSQRCASSRGSASSRRSSSAASGCSRAHRDRSRTASRSDCSPRSSSTPSGSSGRWHSSARSSTCISAPAPPPSASSG